MGLTKGHVNSGRQSGRGEGGGDQRGGKGGRILFKGSACIHAVLKPHKTFELLSRISRLGICAQRLYPLTERACLSGELRCT